MNARPPSRPSLSVWLWSLPLLLLLVLLSARSAQPATAANEEKVCGNINVQNNLDKLAQLNNCTVVDGYLQLYLLDHTKPEDFAVLSFPQLREITHYMLVYRVTGLTSLGKLFPNLMLIRGVKNANFTGQARLMIHDNPDLVEVGLYSLTNITGSVIITNNNKMCHATTIDWGEITNGVSNDTNIVSNNGRSVRSCPDCSKLGCIEDRCWSRETAVKCQFRPLEGCHHLCAGGCYQKNSSRHCYVCNAYLHNEECIKECPSGLYGYARVCITEDECRKIAVNRQEYTVDRLNGNYIPFQGICRDECPYGYGVTQDTKNCMLCKKTKFGSCIRNCDSFKISDEVLRKNYDYRLHTNCTIIKSLEIEIKTGATEDIERRLEELIGKVEIILEQLKIIRSHPLNSLNFLRNLYEIRGESTTSNIALVIRGNKNLQKLWTNKENETRLVKILNGTVSFHYNPKLCMSEVYKFGNMSALPKFSDIEVSSISNGDQYECIVDYLYVETVKIETQTILLKMQKPATEDNLDRFLVYFIEAYKLNESTTECGDTIWKIDDIASKKIANETEDIYHVITNLEPNTEYVYYVKTYTISSKTSMSNKFRNKTLPSKPSTPQTLTAIHVTSTNVTLTWQPPAHPHGSLIKYIIKLVHLKDDQAILDQRSFCNNKTVLGDGVKYRSTPSFFLPQEAIHDQKCTEQCEQQKITANHNMCNSFEHNVDIDSIPLNNRKFIFETCNNFLNIFVNFKCNAMQFQDENYFQYNINYNSNNNNNFNPNNNCTEMWSVSNELEKNTSDSHHGQTHTRFEVQGNDTSYNLVNLKHFSQYVVSLAVCREIVVQELKLNKFVDSCSQETLISFRTMKDDNADIIDSDKINVTIQNNTVRVSWELPKLINSVLHSFKLEYKPIEAYSFVSVCITMKQYENAGRSYTFTVNPGEYQLKIQAVSLAGTGNYSNLKFFYVSESDSSENVHLILMILIFGCILIVLTGVIIRTYFSRKLSERTNIYNLANNPGYVGIYVEDEWELAREDVVIQKILGRGTFGTVHEGIIMPQNVPCAVKSVSKTNFLRYHAEFLNEAAIMKKFSEAYHIVKLLGVVTKSHPPLLVMELMDRGDLKSVLVKSRETDNPPPPNRYTLIRMAAQIADGMAFLEYNKFIHRDLAARNCMVANDMTVKIGDFGMSRQIYTGDYYRKGNKGEMPIRWMAPESLGEGIFTSQSDVWSFGVVIWEMMTLGAQPYSDKSNNEVMAHVLDGNILVLPIFCPDVLAGIVKLCWNWTASQRPKFLKVIETLDVYLDDNFRSVSFYHSHNAENTEDNSPVDQSLMSPCTTYEEDVDNESISFVEGETVAVYSAFQADENKLNNGHLLPM